MAHTRDFLIDQNIQLMGYSPYSLDLVPNDFCFFSHIQTNYVLKTTKSICHKYIFFIIRPKNVNNKSRNSYSQTLNEIPIIATIRSFY